MNSAYAILRILNGNTTILTTEKERKHSTFIPFHLVGQYGYNILFFNNLTDAYMHLENVIFPQYDFNDDDVLFDIRQYYKVNIKED